MKVVISSTGPGLDVQASPMFGRCPMYVLVDTETMACQDLTNPAVGAAGGAGIQAAQYVIEQGAKVVITGSAGPNAFQVFQAAGVPVFLFPGGTVRQAVEAYKAGQLQATQGATAPAHTGMGMAGGGRMGGRGTGRGMGMRMGTAPTPPAAPPMPGNVSQDEVQALTEMTTGLRKQLAEIIERLDRLEKGK